MSRLEYPEVQEDVEKRIKDAVSKSAVERLVSLRWSEKCPTEPGWYWYEDEYYGPAPLEVDWTGFIDRPGARQLEVVIACGDDSEQPTGEIATLGGKWAGPIQQPEVP